MGEVSVSSSPSSASSTGDGIVPDAPGTNDASAVAFVMTLVAMHWPGSRSVSLTLPSSAVVRRRSLPSGPANLTAAPARGRPVPTSTNFSEMSFLAAARSADGVVVGSDGAV
jgi:hypothetical protein